MVIIQYVNDAANSKTNSEAGLRVPNKAIDILVDAMNEEETRIVEDA
jgi:hypothetical protein